MNLAFIEECIEVNNKLSFFHVKQDCECRFHSNIGCGCYPKTSTNPNARCYPIPSSGSGGISLPGLLANPSKHYNSWTLKSNLDLFCSLQVETKVQLWQLIKNFEIKKSSQFEKLTLAIHTFWYPKNR